MKGICGGKQKPCARLPLVLGLTSFKAQVQPRAISTLPWVELIPVLSDICPVHVEVATPAEHWRAHLVQFGIAKRPIVGSTSASAARQSGSIKNSNIDQC